MSLDLDLEVYKTVLESLPTGVYLVDRDRRVVFWNDGAERISGYLRQEAIGRCCADNLLMHCDENNVVLCGDQCPLRETVRDGKRRKADVFLRHKDGQRIPVRIQSVAIRNEHGTIVGAVECFDERAVVATLGVDVHKFGMHHHGIRSAGELPDYRAMVACLDAEIVDFRTSHVPFGVLSIRVDNLEHVQRTNGCQAVASVVAMVARTLSVNLGHNDIVGRWTEGQFVAIIRSCTAATLVRFAGLLRRLVSITGIPWWGDQLLVSVSMGGTIVREDDTPETVVRRAEVSLESSVSEGGNHGVVVS